MKTYKKQFTLFIAFSIYNNVKTVLSVSNLLCFLELLVACNVAPRTVCNYVSAIKAYLQMYNMKVDWINNKLVGNYLRSISIHTSITPKEKGVLSMTDLLGISEALQNWENPWHFRTAFLLSFYAFLRISNLVPDKVSTFHSTKQLVWGYIVPDAKGALVYIKRAKNLQRYDQNHYVSIPIMPHSLLCPVLAISKLNEIEKHEWGQPLLKMGRIPMIEAQLRRRLQLCLRTIGIDPSSHTYHVFRRSGASIAFNNHIDLENIKSHGAWRSDAVYTYLYENSHKKDEVRDMFRSMELPNSLFGEGFPC